MKAQSTSIALSLVATLILSGCAQIQPSSVSTGSSSGRVVSRLSIEEVTNRIEAEAANRSYQLAPKSEWTFALLIDGDKRRWNVVPGKIPTGNGTWFSVDDATGAVEAVLPMLRPTPELVRADDRLQRSAQALGKIVYPLPIDEFLQRAQLAGLAASSGGRETETLWFLEYTLQQNGSSPERIEVRCYYETPQGRDGPKIVTRAEIAYWDAKVNRYLLTRDS